MIKCQNVKKEYGDITVFNNFSYQFNDNGLYALFGVSGSGKTTLLQILLGIIPFEKGSIFYDSVEYKKSVKYSDIQDQVAYISQDSYFVDYLLMEENLLVQSNCSKEEVYSLTKKFNLEKLLNNYPNQLSGGEKQRFSIIGNLLKGKKIFFLDEPTSSLDKKNKELFYSIIKEISKECLVICSSHDESILSLNPEVIDFNKIDDYTCEAKKNNKPITKENINKDSNYKTSNIFFCMLKQLYRREKIVYSIFVLCFTIVFLLLFACTNYREKLLNSLISNYNLNGTLFFCSNKTGDYCKNILDKYDVDELVYNYNRNIPEEETDSVMSSIDFNVDILSLPYKKDNIVYIEEAIAYGSYYENPNEIILGYQKAVEISESQNVDLKNLIGEKISLLLPDGEKEFTIVGILDKVDNKTKTYFTALLGKYDFDYYYYINGKFNEHYLYDDVLGISEKNNIFPSTAFTIYFENSSKFIKFYNDFVKYNNDSLIRIEDPVDNFTEYATMNSSVQTICLIASVCIITLGLIFYYQIHKTRLSYTEQNYSIYEYYGYSAKKVLIATSLYFIVSIVIVSLISIIIASILSFIVNSIIIHNQLLPFPLFIFSIEWIALFMLLIISVSAIESVILNHTRRNKGWFYLIKEKSDLI